MGTELQTLENDVKKVWTFVVDPGHLILLVLLGAAFFIGSWLYAGKKASAADLVAAVANTKAEAAEKANVTLQQQSTAQIAILTTQNTTTQQEITVLTSSIANRDKQLTVQQQTNSTLPPTDLASRWSTLVKAPNSIKVLPTGDYDVPQVQAVASVNALDAVVTLTANNDQLNQIIVKDDQIIDRDATILNTEKTAHQSDNTTNGLTISARNDTIIALKADASKSKKKWFIIGFVSGFVTGIAAKF